MKSDTRTVLAATLDSASSYSSGPLDVGDLEMLFVSVYATAVSGVAPSLAVSVVDANGNLFKVATIQFPIDSTNAAYIGNGSAFVGTGSSLGSNYGVPYFGDQIQLDLIGSGAVSVSTQISVKGK